MSIGAASSLPRVLVVEDEPLLRLFNADMLSDAGFDVLEASDAYEAIRLLESRQDIHVVFTDVDMPGQIDGFALAKQIEARWPTIGVLITSGRRYPLEQLAAPARGFVPKPFRVEDVISRITAVMRAEPVAVCA